ncbi:MAG: PEGA domain-containing protein [bacterium]|nr:PEGA domain-containing protein [bacterium]
MNGTKQLVSINSEPVGAKVMVDGSDCGKTPVALKLARKKDHSVEIEMGNYITYKTTLSRAETGWIWGNYSLFLTNWPHFSVYGALAWVPSIIIDTNNGSRYKLKPQNINVTLLKKDNPDVNDYDMKKVYTEQIEPKKAEYRNKIEPGQKEYRIPVNAAFLSLLLPGIGQFYNSAALVDHQQQEITKGIFFLVVGGTAYIAGFNELNNERNSHEWDSFKYGFGGRILIISGILTSVVSMFEAHYTANEINKGHYRYSFRAEKDTVIVCYNKYF